MCINVKYNCKLLHNEKAIYFLHNEKTIFLSKTK